jgi:hypothetical protein
MKKITTSCLPLFAAALMSIGSLSAQVYPSAFSNYSPGPMADGVSSIAVSRPVRSVAGNAIGPVTPGTNDSNVGEGSGTVQFVSLGYGGSIELSFTNAVCNRPGQNDLKIWETSYGTPNCVSWPEHAAVWARQDVCQPWILLTPEAGLCQDFELDLGFLSWAKYFRIEDRTNELFPTFQSSNQDAFDVDGIEGFSECSVPSVSAANKYSPNFVYAKAQGLRSNGSPVLGSRSIDSRMLGAPQMNDNATAPAANNFFALGFSGSVTLQFPYTIIDVAGADLAISETTFGDNPGRQCSTYPEKAKFEGSVDGITFFDLEQGPTPGNGDLGNVLCRDGQLEIPGAVGAGGINFIRITDLTLVGPFGTSVVDGYDVDGVAGLNQCASNQPNSPGGKYSEDGEIGEGEFAVSVYPNPAESVATIEVSAINNLDDYTIKVIDIMGRVASTESVNNGTGSFIHNINISTLPAGIYLVSVESNGTREITRLVKK